MKPGSKHQEAETYQDYFERSREMINSEANDLVAKINAQSLTEADKQTMRNLTIKKLIE
jgi:hypothetical protein